MSTGSLDNTVPGTSTVVVVVGARVVTGASVVVGATVVGDTVVVGATVLVGATVVADATVVGGSVVGKAVVVVAATTAVVGTVASPVDEEQPDAIKAEANRTEPIIWLRRTTRPFISRVLRESLPIHA